MKHEQLLELDRACRTSMRAAGELLDAWLFSSQAIDYYGNNIHLVERVVPFFEHLDAKSVVWKRLGEMLNAAGLGGLMLQRHQESITPENPKGLLSQSVVDALSDAPSQVDPDAQALACMRMLHPRGDAKLLNWMYPLIARRLVELLVQYPVLLHPRFSWNVGSEMRLQAADERGTRPSRTLNAEQYVAPLTHLIVMGGFARLPAPNMGVDDASMIRFASHPAVAAGIKARAPRIKRVHLDCQQSQWNQTIGDFMCSEGSTRSALTALLRIDRLRQEAGLKGSLFEGGDGMRYGMRYAVAKELTSCWADGRLDTDFTANRAATGFFDEIKRSALLRDEKFRIEIDSSTMKVLFHMDRRGASPAADAVDRFDRCVKARVETGFNDGAQSATRWVFEYITRTPVQGNAAAHEPLDLAVTTDIARRCLLAGVSREDLEVATAKLTRSNWGNGIAIASLEASMRQAANSFVDAAPSPDQRGRTRVL